MSSNFQFAFLGPQNNYLASVTPIGSNGTLGPSITATYGLPDAFSNHFCLQSNRKYFCNIRGHDFLSHTGQWRTLNHQGQVEASVNLYSEMESLQSLAEKNEIKGYAPNLIVNFGSKPGSYFADAVGLKTYRRVNLPQELENILQDLLLRSSVFSGASYGKIHDVAMNGSEGWVLLLRRGKKYEWGGLLPKELDEALKYGKQRKAAISRIFLNHQHSSEYVLLFADGYAYASLHSDFERPLESILSQWAKNRKLTKNFKLNFNPICYYSRAQQRLLNATYYNSRGIFHLSRGNSSLAMMYFSEAHDQDRSNREIHRNLGMSLVAVQQALQDEVLEQYMTQPVGSRPNQLVLKSEEGRIGEFRMAYVGLAERWDMGELERRLEDFGRDRKREEAWTSSMMFGPDGNGTVYEIGEERLAEELAELVGSPLDGRVHSHELSGTESTDI